MLSSKRTDSARACAGRGPNWCLRMGRIIAAALCSDKAPWAAARARCRVNTESGGRVVVCRRREAECRKRLRGRAARRACRAGCRRDPGSGCRGRFRGRCPACEPARSLAETRRACSERCMPGRIPEVTPVRVRGPARRRICCRAVGGVAGRRLEPAPGQCHRCGCAN